MRVYRQFRIIYLVSGLSIAILVVFGLLYMEKSREQVQYIDAVEHTYKVLSSMDFCEKVLLGSEAAQRGYLLTGENDYKELYEYNLSLIDSSLQAIGAFISDNNSQKTYFFQLRKFVAARVQLLKDNLSLTPADPLYFQNLRNGVNMMDNCRFYMRKMRGVEEALLLAGVEKKK
jgi:CHASE3 domain sensor protein